MRESSEVSTEWEATLERTVRIFAQSPFRDAGQDADKRYTHNGVNESGEYKVYKKMTDEKCLSNLTSLKRRKKFEKRKKDFRNHMIMAHPMIDIFRDLYSFVGFS